MSRPLMPIEECLAGELHDYFLEFIALKKGVPIERTFWAWLIRNKKYTKKELPEHTFRWQFGRLIREGYIGIDAETRTLIPLRNVRISVDR